jgi:type I restriction enzyme S subunit
MEVKKGYKQTEVGVIPEDWRATSIGKLLEFKNGLNKAKSFFDKGTPIVNYMDVFENPGLSMSDITGKVTVNGDEKRNYQVKQGDVFFTRTSETVEEIGMTSVMLEEIQNAVFSGFVLRGRPKNDILGLHYKKYCFRSEIVRKQITSTSSYTTRALTNGRLLSKVFLPLPPTLEEQTDIATALSDADALIQSLEKLIAKKRAIKQGAMQELLTGKKRLPRFGRKIEKFNQTELGVIPEDWRACRFKDVLTGFSSGMTPYRGRLEYYKGDILWITSGELNYNVITNTEEKITKEAVIKTNLKILPKGTFLMAITGLEAEGTRGSCGIVGVEATTNQSCMALFPIKGEITTEYLYHFYVHYGNELALKYCQGTKQQSYTGRIAKILPINLPPTLTEQTSIATILSDMDAEIATLQNKLTKYKQIKQGMMQNLLTGRIRLI